MLSSLLFYFFFGGGGGGGQRHIQQKRKNSIEPEVNENQLSQPCEAAKAFAHAQYLQVSFNNPDLHDSSGGLWWHSG